MIKNKSFFKKYSLFTLIFTLLVILWGAWVRLSHSGEGCGSDWPLCKGSLLPEETSASFIEWFHRLSSGLSLIFVIILFILSLKIYPKKHLLRKLTSFALLFIIIEALIGAVLVLSSFVGANSSTLRVLVFLFHLLNSLFLISTLALCWEGSFFNKLNWKKSILPFLIAFPILILTGGIASLAGTLFPANSLIEAFLLDWAPSSHITLKLRPLHPLIAGLFIVFFWFKAKPFGIYKRTFQLLVFAFLFGATTLLLLSPVGMKLIHLLVAYMIGIILTLNSTYFTK